ncbi:MAG TPA: hypothetical protein VGE28_09475 [Pseudomonas sp.]
MIFDREDFLSRTLEAAFLEHAQDSKAKFDKKKAYLATLITSPNLLQHWDEATERLKKFDEDYKAWNLNYSKAIQTKLQIPIADILSSGQKLLEDLQSYFESIIPNETRSNDIERLKSEIMSEIERKIEQLSVSIDEKVTTGLNNIINLKAEIGLAGNFGDNLMKELESATKSKDSFIKIFVGAILSIPLSIIIFESLYPGDNQIFSTTVKLGLAASFGFFSYFAFSQYKLYQLLTFRYKHLIGFLGGGATFIGQLVDGDDIELRSEINQKMASLFMSIDDVLGLIKRNKHPAEFSAEKAIKLFESAAKIFPQR